MAISIIPFSMPEPMDIPEHIVDMLHQLPADQAIHRAMELLLEIEVAEAMVYEENDAAGNLNLGAVVAVDDAKKASLAKLLADATDRGLGLRAQTENSALLVLGQVDSGDEKTLPAALKSFVLAGSDEGDIGFIYVLPLAGEEGQNLGVLTLLRPAVTGPLNHEQPNITERVRQELCSILRA